MPLPLANDQESASERDLDRYHRSGNATVTDPSHLLPADSEEPPQKGSSWRTILFVLIGLAIIGIVGWRIHESNVQSAAKSNNASRDAASRAIPVMVSPVVQTTVPVYLTALGTVTPYNTVTLHSRVDGQLLKVNFVEGQAVKEGQLLIQIDPRPYQAALDQATGTLAKDQATANNSNAEAQRYTALYNAGVVSKESQQTQITSAGQASGVIAADQAAIEAAKVNLGYTRIFSPISGVVGLRGVDPGNIVHASDTTGLVVITQIHPIAVIFTLPEDQIPQVQQAMAGGKKLVAEAYDRGSANKLATGTLLTIDNQIDTTTGTAKLKAVFDNQSNSLFPNQFVNIRLVLNNRDNAILVPTAAIQSGTNGNFVFVEHGGAGTGGARRGNGGGRRNGAPGGGNGGNANAGANAGAANGSGNAAGQSNGGPRTNPDGTPRTPTGHVNVVNVHVDFVQGANSILSPGTLKAGDLVVVDGQEKLNDGSNVAPQFSPASATTPLPGQPSAPADNSGAQPGQGSGDPSGQHHHGGNGAQAGAVPAQGAQGQHQHHNHNNAGGGTNQ